MFAEFLRALVPYATEVVVIGGWVHALYLADARVSDNSGGSPVLTDDIDLAVPRTLTSHGRPSLVELITTAGFERDPLSDLTGAPIMLRRTVGSTVIDLDLLTEAADPRTAVAVEGQTGLYIAGYPGQAILLANTQWMFVGTAFHPSLDPPIRVRVPTLPAYVFHKGLSSAQRVTGHKRAKDLVYLAEILQHPTLGRMARAGLRDLAMQYPEYYQTWQTSLDTVTTDRRLLRLIAEQLLLAGSAVGSEEDVIASVVRRIRRMLLDAAGTVV